MAAYAIPVTAQDITITNSSSSNATIVITMPSGFTAQAGFVYDILVNLAVPSSVSGASCTIGGVYVHNKVGNYKRFPALKAPFILRAAFLGDPDHYNFISLRRAVWTMCA